MCEWPSQEVDQHSNIIRFTEQKRYQHQLYQAKEPNTTRRCQPLGADVGGVCIRMSWWATALGGLFGGRGFLTRTVDWWDNIGRRKFLREVVNSHGPEGALTVARAIAIAEGRADLSETDHPPTSEPPIQVTAEREQPKAIEPPKPASPGDSAEPVPPDDSAEPPP
ncbi:hypothetical protein AB0M48_11015 [Lentzea sp. NPDC051208]|uniref:hypothetical protein n=1 Tax=Lentzea sp. NPDC051208 TaxID=3154642 RepID=UPI00343CC6F9